MKTILSIFALAVGTIIFYNLYLRKEQTVGVSPDLTTYTNLGNSNKAEFIAGCKVFEGPEKPAVTYPTQKRNFLALTCALEVPPPLEVVLMQKEIKKENKK